MNEGDEKPHDTFIREFEEEAGFKLEANDLKLLDEYLVEVLDTYRYTFIVEKELNPHKIKLGEGGGFAFIPQDKLSTYDLCPRSLKDIKFFLENKN